MTASPRPPQIRPADPAARSEMLRLLSGHFTRAEPRGRALAYVQALLADPTRASAAEIAAQAGAVSAWSTQRLLTRTVWDADLLRDSIRAHVVRRLGTSAPCAVLCRHETVRAGTSAVAVTPAGTRTAGRERNTQTAALLCYVSRGVGALVDRELHLPPQWTSDPARCARAGVPPERVRSRNMADLGQEMLEGALAASVPIGWVFGGPDFADPRLRQWLCLRRLPFCVELPQLPGQPAPSEPPAPRVDPGQKESWQLLSRGLGTFGRPAPGFGLTLLARRQPSGQISRFLLHASLSAPDIPAARAMAAAGPAAARAIHEADTRAGLSSHQVRSWVAWYRHTTLAMTAAALRLETAPPAMGPGTPDPKEPDPTGTVCP
ncbi:transposase [Streptomyces anulatus]|uniref:IS701 family transposase n=1 Tax=Streptomyces anulatus TaxID=1892 RepID=UPI002E33D4BF|nr:transposase [Streptomyces anulatus]